MSKFRVDVWYKGCTQVEVEADNEEDASWKAIYIVNSLGPDEGVIDYQVAENTGDIVNLEDEEATEQVAIQKLRGMQERGELKL